MDTDSTAKVRKKVLEFLRMRIMKRNREMKTWKKSKVGLLSDMDLACLFGNRKRRWGLGEDPGHGHCRRASSTRHCCRRRTTRKCPCPDARCDGTLSSHWSRCPDCDKFHEWNRSFCRAFRPMSWSQISGERTRPLSHASTLLPIQHRKNTFEKNWHTPKVS